MRREKLSQQQSFVISEPRTSEIGLISVCMISLASVIVSSLISLPRRNSEVFLQIKRNRRDAAGGDVGVVRLNRSRTLSDEIAVLTVAMSRYVRLQTFSKLKCVKSVSETDFRDEFVFGFGELFVAEIKIFERDYSSLRSLFKDNSASSARNQTVISPIGEALTKFPASVAMLRIGVDETSFRCL